MASAPGKGEPRPWQLGGGTEGAAGWLLGLGPEWCQGGQNQSVDFKPCQQVWPGLSPPRISMSFVT